MAIDQEASSSNSSNSNSALRTCKYDIFLSFRGEDTRKGFTDHLYHALKRSGLRVFRDDNELERGEVISEQLKQAIEDSHFAIVILSKNYASSSWCLTELQHILYSRDNVGQQVFPIFYDVDPSHVRHQSQSFAEAFDKHQKRGKDNKIMESWRDSLTKVANLSGWDCEDRAEAELIDTVVEELWTKLRHRLPPYSEGLIGIDNKVDQVEPLLEMGLNDVRIVGLWGLPGVGKTTIAWAIFEKYRNQFEISCFVHNVRTVSERDGGEVQLQSQLLSHLKVRNMEIENTYEGKKIIQNRCCNKKVLLILDDVSHTTHLENLASSPNWFGAGSRVIITTRHLDLLCREHIVYVHEVQTMNPHESLQLFCQKAFVGGKPSEGLLELSKAVCDYANGLPLALSVLGSFFCGRSSVLEWEDALDMMKKVPHKDIFRKLEISFDALTDTEQTIFLDIACFFNCQSKNKITRILESCGFNAKIGITTLQEKSMLKEYNNVLVMHDLLEQMGRKIVLGKSSNDVGNRSRLWTKEDIDEVMENNLGTKEIQAMVSFTSCEAFWNPKAFSTLRNLRLLMVSSDFNLPHGLKYLSHTLKVVHWEKYPLDTLPFGNWLSKLVDLRMRHSKLKKLWNKSLCLKNLKFLDLSFSKNLIETPDFSKLPNLEKLALEGCEKLIDLHASIGQHKKLQVLNLKGCKSLTAHCLKKLEMTPLKEFVLCGCTRVKFLPKFGESMKNLETLDAGETNLVKLPKSLGLLTGLKTLKLRGCKNLVCLPRSIHNLKCLVLLDIAGCSKFARLPEKLNEIEALEELDASETDITEIPCSVGGLEKLKKLSFHGCERSTLNSWSMILPWRHSIHKGLTLPISMFNLKSLKKLDLSYCGIDDGSIPDDFGGLSSLWWLDLSGNKFKNLPAGCISNLLNLGILVMNSCMELQSLPQIPPRVTSMCAEKCDSLDTVEGEQLSHLFASRDQEFSLTNFEMNIAASEISPWFENQVDLYRDHKGDALVMIDIPPCEEILGIGLCTLLESNFYFREGRLLLWRLRGCGFIMGPRHRNHAMPASNCKGGKKRKSCHLWVLFYYPTKYYRDMWQSRKYSQIPFVFTARPDNAEVLIKCGWHVIRKVDVENSGSSKSQSLLPILEQQTDRVVDHNPVLMTGLGSPWHFQTAFTKDGPITLPDPRLDPNLGIPHKFL
ncbi:TMV resistance protein N-like [Neltuma alba]|uniref:TMV resistance protein N-like n=1 Tax=Neltuma alba TaxID=207710 RepID=UPI0010A3B390|nr:TMV resistance protein N-like [Prosopis alba]